MRSIVAWFIAGCSVLACTDTPSDLCGDLVEDPATDSCRCPEGTEPGDDVWTCLLPDGGTIRHPNPPDASVDSEDAGRDAGPFDAGMLDGGPSDAENIDATSDAGPVVVQQYVLSSSQMPSRRGELAADLDGDGTVDDVVGALHVALLNLAACGVECTNDPLDESVQRGDLILLQELAASSFREGPIAATAAIGSNPVPSACDGPEDLLCGKHLVGGASFDVVAVRRGEGTADEHRVVVETEQAWIPVAFLGASGLLPLRRVRLEVDESSLGLDGRLVGFLSAEDVNVSLLPLLRAGVMSSSDLVPVFDADGNGDVSFAEVRDHSLISETLRPDVDADGDGTPESFGVGVGIAMVRAVFSLP